MSIPKCPKCNIEMEDVGGDDYADMTEGQQADYDAGFNHLFECLECGYSLVYEHQVPMYDGEENWETPEEYSDELLKLLGDYDENKINECLNKKFYIEAIVDLHRHIGEQLRYLFIKKTKGIFGIPLDSNDIHYKEVVPLVQYMNESSLISFAFIFKIIEPDEKKFLGELNEIRNKFVHSFNKKAREKLLSNRGYIHSVIKHCQELEIKLAELVQGYN